MCIPICFNFEWQLLIFQDTSHSVDCESVFDTIFLKGFCPLKVNDRQHVHHMSILSCPKLPWDWFLIPQTPYVIAHGTPCVICLYRITVFKTANEKNFFHLPNMEFFETRTKFTTLVEFPASIFHSSNTKKKNNQK